MAKATTGFLTFMVDEDTEARLTGLRLDVWNVIRRSAEYGRTCDEIEKILEQPHQSVSPRILELVQLHAIVASKAKRKTERGVSARVYVLSKYAKMVSNCGV